MEELRIARDFLRHIVDPLFEDIAHINLAIITPEIAQHPVEIKAACPRLDLSVRYLHCTGKADHKAGHPEHCRPDPVCAIGNLAWGGLVFGCQEPLRIAINAGQRRAELVRHSCYKVSFFDCEGSLLLECPCQNVGLCCEALARFQKLDRVPPEDSE